MWLFFFLSVRVGGAVVCIVWVTVDVCAWCKAISWVVFHVDYVNSLEH